MVTKRQPVNVPYVNWYDGQQVTEDELQDEQTRHLSIDAANIANFMGSGILKENSIAPTILDTNNLNTEQQLLFDGYSFDGSNVYTADSYDVSDTIKGVQLAISMTDVRLDGAATSRVVIIGDTFGDGLIHDELIFERNGTKITRGRYKNIRAIVFNNFAGNLQGSKKYALEEDGYGWIGRCAVREANKMEVSTDIKMAAQTLQPSIFFNSFIPATIGQSLDQMLQNAIGSDKSVSDLNIALNSSTQRQISTDDVTTKVGQKFLSQGNNIQKISVLLSVPYNITDGYSWSGSLIMTIHELQTEVFCPVEPTPDNSIDFDPDPAIVAQLSLDINDLTNQGIVLSDSPQKVDFVFTGTKMADPIRSTIEDEKYYVFTIGRSGDAHTGIITFEEATNRADNSYMVVFDGSTWVNVTDSDMWYSVEGDYIKISDGISYVDGVGLEIPKTKEDGTNTEVAYVEGFWPLYAVTYDAYNYVVVEESTEFSDPEQDQRTGNNVYSRVVPDPGFSLINQTSLNSLVESTPAPLLLGRIKDQNPRGNTSSVSGLSTYIGLITDNEVNILNPDADVRTFNWVGSIFSPNVSNSADYRIIKQTLYNDAYGDVTGDGEITSADYDLVSSWISKWGASVAPVSRLSLSDGYVQQLIIDGHLETLQFLRADVNNDGYVDITDANLINNYVNGAVSSFSAGSTFSRMQLLVESLIDPLTTSTSMWTIDTTLKTIPYGSVSWQIDYFATWKEDWISIEDLRRPLPTTFTEQYSSDFPNGKNNFYVPGDLILEGYMSNTDGTPYSVDFEMTHLSLKIPVIDSYGSPVVLDGYSGILLFDNFVAESSSGLTAGGFQAMKYSDGTYVQTSDFTNGKVKITASLQSVASRYDYPFSADIDDIVGLYYDPSTSLLTLKMEHLYPDGYDMTLPPTDTRVLVTVFLKKAGFENATREITAAQMRSLLGI